MINKLLITALIACLVWVFAVRKPSQNKAQPNHNEQSPSLDEGRSLSVRQISYVILGLLLLASLTVFIADQRAPDPIVEVTLINAQGQRSVYHAKTSNLHGRSFTTQDGRLVQLAETDRIETKPVNPEPHTRAKP